MGKSILASSWWEYGNTKLNLVSNDIVKFSSNSMLKFLLIVFKKDFFFYFIWFTTAVTINDSFALKISDSSISLLISRSSHIFFCVNISILCIYLTSFATITSIKIAYAIVPLIIWFNKEIFPNAWRKFNNLSGYKNSKCNYCRLGEILPKKLWICVAKQKSFLILSSLWRDIQSLECFCRYTKCFFFLKCLKSEWNWNYFSILETCIPTGQFMVNEPICGFYIKNTEIPISSSMPKSRVHLTGFLNFRCISVWSIGLYDRIEHL